MLAEIGNTEFDKKYHAERVGMLGMLGLLHECAESVTGDLASPVKYASEAITREIKQLEDDTERMCVASLPQSLQKRFASYVIKQEIEPEYKNLVKAADDIVALSKAKEEVLNANSFDFTDAMENLHEKVNLHGSRMPEVKWFIEHFSEGYSKTIDKLMSGTSGK